jgi:polygalacturonase/regulation of enolase protein 1 (concanavalin A-like superfamily)
MIKLIAVVAATLAALLLRPSLASADAWNSQDVGAVAAAGSSINTTNADGTVSATVKGSGSDIWDVADEFQFDYQTLTGDGTITGRVASLQPTDNWAKAGVMIRETLATGSRHAFAAVTVANGIAFQRRTATNGQSSHTSGPAVAAPYWVRLTRSANTFSAYSSADGTNWTLIGQDTIAMATTVFVGLAVTSHLDGTLNTVTFDHVVVNSAGPPPSGWSSQDVGAVGAVGSSTNTTNADGTVSATVKGSGWDIWDVADEFQFDFQALAGDGTITARVASLTPTDNWAKAGVMIREQLTTGSTNAFVAVTPANGVDFQRRTTTGSTSGYTAGPLSVTAPYWVRLTRSGNTFSAYSSADGTNWTLIGQATITMAASAYIGLAVTSHNDGTLNTASFDHVTLGSAGTPTVSLTVNPANVPSGGTTQLTWTSTNVTSCTASGGWSGSRATSGSEMSSALSSTTTFTLTCTGPGGTASDSKTVTVAAPPGAWSNQDVGAVGASGSSTTTTNADGTVSATVRGSGVDIWDTADEFQFDYQLLTGDGTITARVASLQQTNNWAKAGVMIREQLTTGSTNAFVAVTPANGVDFQRRNTTGSASGYTAGPLSVTAPYWVRLTRSGNLFSAYSSADGTTWTFIGQTTITMPTTAYVGLAVTSHSDGTLNTTSFDHVTVSSAGPPASGWSNQDVGSVGAAGSSTNITNADGTVSATVKGSGSDIWDTADEFQFDFQTLSGDGTITARVASQTPTDPWAKAGVMIRETLGAGSVHAFAAVTVANGVAFQRRTATNGVSAHIYGPSVAAPYWVRLTRGGSTFSAYASPDGAAWTLVGQATITMANTVYVGLGVTSHHDGTLDTASFDHVVVTSAPTNGSAVSVNLAPYGNVQALVNDGTRAGVGVDGLGNAYSQTLTGTSVTWAGVPFTLGASGMLNGVKGGTVTVTAGHYSSVMLLATAGNANRPGEQFFVNYTDGSTTTTQAITQGLSDWRARLYQVQGNYQGESRALAMSHWVTTDGTPSPTKPGSAYLYGYELAIDGSRTVTSIQLPANVVVVAMDLIAVAPTTYSSACQPHTYGANGDGTDSTTMIQNAIDACSAQQGGGVVELSARWGTNYVTRPLTLKSNVQLQIDSGVTLKAGWTMVPPPNLPTTYAYAYINWVYQAKEALISANGADHVGIVGNGIIDGGGNAGWWDLALTEEAYSKDSTTYKFSWRPWLVEFYKCDTVRVSGVKLMNSPYWTQVLRFSDNITEYGVVTSATNYAPGGTNTNNTDGLVLVGSTNVTLSDLNLGVGDDNIAIKSGLPVLSGDPKEAGLSQVAKATAQVRISNIFAGENAAGLTDGRGSGGIVIGSEASNGVNDVTIEHVYLRRPTYGFRIKSDRDRGGAIHHITAEDMVMDGGGFMLPLNFNDYYKSGPFGPSEPPYDIAQVPPLFPPPQTPPIPNIHDIIVRDVKVTDAGHKSVIVGLPEACIRDVTLSNVTIASSTSDYGIELRHMTGTFTNVTGTPDLPLVLEENVTVTTAGGTIFKDAQSGQVACSQQTWFLQ